MALKVMALRRDGQCVICLIPQPVGTRAQWDSDTKAVTCLSCVAGPQGAAASSSPAGLSLGDEPLVPVVELAPIDVGRPGASARKEFERRQAKREAQVEEKWGTGRLGRMAKFLSDDPQTTKAWDQGAAGEERVAQILHERLGDDAVLLHDRKVPRTKGNIDHLAIAANGVWIIDAKKYKGKVEKRDVGGLFRTDLRLYVGGRDRSKSVVGLGWQVDAVRAALGDEDIPVTPSLSFVGAEWPLFFAKPFQLDGVWISWPGKLAELVLGPGPLGADEIERVARLLASKLPAN